MKSVYLNPVNFDAGIRTYPCAGAASCAVVGIRHVSVMIAAVVDLIGLQRQSVGRTRNDAEIAALASLDVDRDSAFYFCHN